LVEIRGCGAPRSSSGLGFEAARRLLADGHDVWVAASDEERGRAAAQGLGARFVQLDVTDDASVAAVRVSAHSLAEALARAKALLESY
jgi:NAD(P)-dependent dehydrogenase (short-subunit alcohol dehydrogenase family)